MLKLLVDKLPRILKNKKRLEETLEVKITNRGKEIYVKGKPEKEYIAEKVILALDFGFPFSSILDIVEEDCIFEVMNIKDYTKRNDLETVRARIIGSKGKTLKTLTDLTKCHIEIKENFVGIIGFPEIIPITTNAIISLIQGSKQGNVYAYLEKHHPKFEPDLGLKKKK